MNKAKSFVLYGDFAQHFALLTDSEIGLLFRSVFDYVNTDAIPQNLPPAVAMAFSVLRVQIDRDKEKYTEVCKKRAQAGKIGGQQRAANARQAQANQAFVSKSKQTQANQADTDSDTVTDTDIKLDGKADKQKRFTPPSVDEVRAYCEQRHNGIDPEYFVAFYVRNGWRVGRNPMKDWKAAIITWEKNNKTKTAGGESLDYI